jgi:hypoxanthine phosphoribosyltransferase
VTGRVFDHAFAWQMTHRQLTSAASLLADAAARQFGHVDQVIAIERGGTEPARIIASQLGANLRAIRARHNPTSDLYARRPARSRAPPPASGQKLSAAAC